MAAANFLSRMSSLENYRQSLSDASQWRPVVERVCREQDWACGQVRPGLAGTFPAFIVDDRHVIKFFGPLFGGEQCWLVEKEAAFLMSGLPEIPVAGLTAFGKLETDSPWAYLVFEYVAGASIGEVYAGVPFEDKLRLAGWLGEQLPKMHRTKVKQGTALPSLDEQTARGWFSGRWSKDQARWPVHLARQVERYLADNRAAYPPRRSDFIHADLTQDHFLGSLESGRWETKAVIDFGDAMLGNIYYELAALHLDLFDCDKRLLSTFLKAYGLPPHKDFVRTAMVTSLLHQFDVYGHLFAWKPELKEIRTLEQLADRLWNVD